MASVKTNRGNFFEDFSVGMTLVHATPRTITAGDIAFYNALYGPRFAVQSSDAFANSIGYAQSPVDDLIVFHVILGKTVSDISLNAVANLGYAECRFLRPVFVGDTLRAESEIIGLRQNSNGKSGVVYVRTKGFNQNDEAVLEYARWVMVNKLNLDAPAPDSVVPDLAESVEAGSLVPPKLDGLGAYDFDLAGSSHRWGDYAVGEKIDHIDAVTLEEAEHQMATRLYQNTAKVHFNEFEQKQGRFGRRLVYGGVIISIARALSFNGLENAFLILGLNGGRHVAPAFGGDTIFCWSEVLDKDDLAGVDNFGALRLRTVATKDLSSSDFPYQMPDGQYKDKVILDIDYWAGIPK